MTHPPSAISASRLRVGAPSPTCVSVLNAPGVGGVRGDRLPALVRSLSYRDAGVDVDAGDKLVDKLRPLADSTKTPWTLGSVGGFAGLSLLPSGYREPVLVSGTDGVGTKLKVAFATGRHDTIGIDLVAMCVNDVLTVGATPLFFLDYFATGALQVEQAEAVVRGIATGCKTAGCALLGGETAELPGMYNAGEYDLAGFCVGVVERNALLDGSRVVAGDRLVAVASNGLHSNGFSLARKALLEEGGLHLETSFSKCLVDAGFPESDGADSTKPQELSLADVLLRPTPIYRDGILGAVQTGSVHALCHITGGGITGNLPRVLPAGLGAAVHVQKLDAPRIFSLIQKKGNVSNDEMYRTFNMGVGLVVVCPKDSVSSVVETFVRVGHRAMDVGEVVADQSCSVQLVGSSS